MGILIDVEQVEAAVQQLRSVGEKLVVQLNAGGLNPLSSFSQVSGLADAGRTLSPIGDVNAPEANQAVATYLLGTANILETALNNTLRTDDSLSGALASLGPVFEGRVNQVQPQLIELLQKSRSVDPKTNTFANPAAVATGDSSLHALHAKLLETDTSRAMSASEFWNSNAELIADAMEELNEVQHALSSSAETSWIHNAMRTITQVQNAGMEYVANSRSLAAHTAMLADAADAEKLIASSTVMAYDAAPSPEEKLAIEQAYLLNFPARMTSNLVAAIPTFNRLLPELKEMSGDSYSVDSIPSPAAPAFEPAELPEPIQNALINRGYGDIANAKTPSEVLQNMGRPSPNVLDSIPAGATPTQAASAVLTPPSTNAMAPTPGAISAGAHPGAHSPTFTGAITPATTRGANSGGASAGTNSGAGGFAPIAGGPSNAAGTGRHAARGNQMGVGTGVGGPGGSRGGSPASQAVSGRGAGNGIGTGRSAGAGAGTYSGGGMHAGRPGFGTGGGVSAGAGVGPSTGFGAGSPGAHGATPHGSTGHAPTGSGTANGAHGAHSAHGAHATNGAHSANNAAGAHRGGGVIAGQPMMAGRNQNGRASDKAAAKVKTVTSAVERDGNLKALLGDAPLLLPEVIGYNVRR
ncbi:hypothetical protein HMPREF3145_07545 [Corynebacterium sp. HMSC05C01]|uniref:hypothetical protein n=1 Tax=Corynebacterium sp. HMSC05C01 TaxID=1581113 RepID=UPI0008A5601B|nr:hypothetical protein [Corynebacterium sp. HMSC05C01]OFT69196.1 hypothetical protein HMPREF3145_07545 [Corynebacterium sp. HMSC05C01]